MGERSGEARALNTIGLVYRLLGEPQQALDYYKQALALHQAVGDRSGEDATLNNIGVVYHLLGEMQQVLDCYENSLALSRAMGNWSSEAITLNNIAEAYYSLGEPQQALDYHKQALALSRATNNRVSEANTFLNIGGVYRHLGELQQTLSYYEQALALFRAIDYRVGEACTLNNIGGVYRHLGEPQKALSYHEQALALSRAMGDRSGEATTLNNIGLIYELLSEPQKALTYYNQALAFFRAVGYRHKEAITLNNIGDLILSEPQKALTYYKQALELSRAGEGRMEEASTLNSIGLAYYLEGELQKALDYYKDALALSQAISDCYQESIALAGIAYAERDCGDLIKARKLMKKALAIIESLRTKVVSSDLRASFFAAHQDYYKFYIDLLMQLHQLYRATKYGAKYAAAAFQASERSRARSLLEILTEARTDIRQGVDLVLVKRERTLQQQLNAKAERLTQLLSSKHTEEQATRIKKEIEALTTEYQQVQAQIRAKSPRYAALTQPVPLNLREIQQQVLDADTLLLEYSLGTERSFLWTVSSDEPLKYYVLPPRAEIEAAARSFYELLTAPKINRNEGETVEQWFKRREDVVKKADVQLPEAASRLSQIVLSPTASQLGTKRLLIVSDGALQYIPFSALPDPAAATNGRGESKQLLIVDHEIVSLLSASTLAVLRREMAVHTPPLNSVAIFADPVYEKDDSRVKRGDKPPRSKLRSIAVRIGLAFAANLRGIRSTEIKGNMQKGEKTRSDAGTLPIYESLSEVAFVRSADEVGLRNGGTLSRLPFSRDEAKAVLSLTSKDKGLVALDFEASRATATSTDLSQYRFVHFATHGLLNSEHPELSGVVLSLVDEQGEPQDGFLRLHDIYNLKLQAEMVVLSACQTGLGKEIKGEGLVGLTRGVMYAGAERVVASLWQVDDEATAEFMKLFYEAVLKEGQTPASALRAAQEAMSKQKRWQSPFYWAAFVLQGEYK